MARREKQYDAVGSGYEEPLAVPEPEPAGGGDAREEGATPPRGPYRRKGPGEPDGRGRWSRSLPPEVRAALREQEAARREARGRRLAASGRGYRGGHGHGGRPLKARRHAAREAALPADRRCPG